MSLKMMMTGTGIMCAGVAGLVINRVSGQGLSNALTRMRCPEIRSVAASSEATCGANSALHWLVAMGTLFFIGVGINLYGRIKQAKRIETHRGDKSA